MIFMQCAINIAALTNYFYAIGLLYLAQKASDKKCDDAQYNDENCSKIWGFEPVSIVTLVWTISGFAGALFLPYIGMYYGTGSNHGSKSVNQCFSHLPNHISHSLPQGALFDHTRYRWEIGAILSTVIVIIQAAQIYSTQSTWLVMTMLEAVNGFLFQVSFFISINLCYATITGVRYNSLIPNFNYSLPQ